MLTHSSVSEQMKPTPFVARQASVDGGVETGPTRSSTDERGAGGAGVEAPRRSLVLLHPWWCDTHLYHFEDGGRYELSLPQCIRYGPPTVGSAYKLAESEFVATVEVVWHCGYTRSNLSLSLLSSEEVVHAEVGECRKVEPSLKSSVKP